MLTSKPLVSTYRVLTTTEHGIFLSLPLSFAGVAREKLAKVVVEPLDVVLAITGSYS